MKSLLIATAAIMCLTFAAPVQAAPSGAMHVAAHTDHNSHRRNAKDRNQRREHHAARQEHRQVRGARHQAPHARRQVRHARRQVRQAHHQLRNEQRRVGQARSRIQRQRAHIRGNRQELARQHRTLRENRRRLGVERRFDWSAYHQGVRPVNWQRHRNFDRALWERNFRAEHRYRSRAYRRPVGWYYRRWSFGMVLPRPLWTRDNWIGDYGQFGLANPPYGYVWVRYGDDALLVNVDDGRILRVVYGLYY